MRNKKEFFGVLISVLVCVFLVGLIVYATTVGSDITVSADLTVTSGARIGTDAGSTHITELADGTLFVEGDAEFDGTVYFDRNVAIHQGVGTAEPATELSVIGTVSISEDLWASGSFQFGGGEGVATASYSRLGGTATGHGLSNANDLVINGSLEVDGTAWFDAGASISDDLQIGTITQADAYSYDTLIPHIVIGNDTTEFQTGLFASASSYGIYVTSEGIGIYGYSDHSQGVFGETRESSGVWGRSSSGYGVLGSSTSLYGVYGTTTTGAYAIYANGGLYAEHASISTNFTVDGKASISGVLQIGDDGATITTGVASPSATCVKGSLYIDTVLGEIHACDANGDWSLIQID